MSKGTIVIYGPVVFPQGDAGGNRIFHTARMISEAGWQVFVVGKGTPRAQDRQTDGTYSVAGIQYDSVYHSGVSRRRKLYDLISGGISYRSVWIKHGIEHPYAIISYSNFFLGSFAVRQYAQKRSIPYIADVVEWYSTQQFRQGAFSVFYINNHLGVRTFKTLNSVMVISKLLESYFSETVPNVIRIPPTIDTSSVPFTPKLDADRIKLIYAGIPGKKDYLHLVIQGIRSLRIEERAKIQLDIYGLNFHELQQYLDATGCSERLAGLENTIFAHGRVSRDTVLQALQQADFSILLRPQMRFSNAGFPSKVPESLAVGTPVILNYTSDLALYIHDYREGIIVEDCSVEAIAAALRKVLALSREDLNSMRVQARQCAEEHFDYHNYIDPLRIFLESAK